MLDNLLIAVESEAQIVDIGRVSGFMQKVWLLPVLVPYPFSRIGGAQVKNGVI